ncbi:MAG: YicC family protein [Synergistaceae bacterium]|jgi:uncharacterized protein (TIGR00255 family)|nr:YicC family protein [Synergistaceae bacterium]
MYVSMTGFSSARIEREWGTISLELSSVNHRYQEIYARLPRELGSWEPWFHQKLRGLYRRGKVQARIEIMWAASALAVSVNKDVLASYFNALAETREALGPDQGEPISIDSLVNLPGVLDSQERFGLSRDDATEQLLSSLLEQGAARWQEMRLTEGAHLKSAVNIHLVELERLLGEISAKWADAKDAAFDAMKERITKALDSLGAPQPDDSRFVQEVVFIADRWDVTEELARLDSHIAKFRETEDSSESAGRKLDFLIQEMNREVNTLNSKIADAGIRWLAVEAKTSLERIREQIQNLE